MLRFFTIVATTGAFALSACGPSVASLDGEYRAQHVNGVDRLRLNADGSFRQEFFLHGGDEPFAIHESRWTYDRIPGAVVLVAPMHVSDYAPAEHVIDDTRYWVRSCDGQICLDQFPIWSGRSSIHGRYDRQAH